MRETERVLRTQVMGAHRSFADMFAEMRVDLRSGDRGRAQVGLASLRERLEIHLEQEDSLYFPALEAVRGDLRGTLASLTEHHVRLRVQLDQMSASLGSRGLEEIEQLFEEFIESLARHELREEEMLHSLDAAASLRLG